MNYPECLIELLKEVWQEDIKPELLPLAICAPIIYLICS